MNHKWENNQCERCGITRKKKKAKVIQLHLAVDQQGTLLENEQMKTIQLWSYSQGGFNRPDCPDELLNERRAA